MPAVFSYDQVGDEYEASVTVTATDGGGASSSQTASHRLTAKTTVTLRNVKFRILNTGYCFDTGPAHRFAGKLTLGGAVGGSHRFSEELRRDRPELVLLDSSAGTEPTTAEQRVTLEFSFDGHSDTYQGAAEGGGPFDAPDQGNNQRAPLPTGFGVGIQVEPVGHFARITVGVSGGPNGLAALAALEDCDFWAGKNDFELRWNLDGRTSRSRFDLAEGESYVEQGFRRVARGVHYPEHRYWIRIVERDGVDDLLEPWRWRDGANLRSGPEPAGIHPVVRFRRPVTLFWHVAGASCLVRLDYTYTVAMSDTAPRP